MNVIQKKSFTLVELLVVIAIISILMALLSPTLKRAKETGNQLKCMNNLRQFHLAATFYVTEWEGILMPCRTNGGGWAWQRIFTDKNPGYLGWTSVSQARKMLATLNCPSNKDSQYFYASILDPWSNIAYNRNLGDFNILVTLNMIEDPAKTIEFFDAANAAAMANELTYTTRTGFVHSGAANFIFMDGHASAHKLQEITNSWWTLAKD